MSARLLTRTEFREQVFARDGGKCVVCAAPAQDAHHIIERRLFPDGGYYLDNGASVCGKHHLQAEQTTLTPEELRQRAGITQVILPPSLTGDETYTKWGDVQLKNGLRAPGPLFTDESIQKILSKGQVLDLYSHYRKYPRIPHLPQSPGTTNDDLISSSTASFMGQEVVITEKLDGENTTLYRDYFHARSLDSAPHISQSWVKNLHAKIAHEIPEGWRLCGENLYATHSIHYESLPSYFLLFSIFDEQDRCLSWADTQELAQILELETVPVLYQGIFDPKVIEQLARPRPSTYGPTAEGFVLRETNSFPGRQLAEHMAKWVRPNHVQSSHHWRFQELVPNALAPPNSTFGLSAL